ncbi:hypothetical protein BH10PSE7_BH10PSE7_15250 [soil metagenome]
MRIYVASSWRNKYQPEIVHLLRGCGHAVYDFRNPFFGLKDGFRWSELDGGWESWTPAEYRKQLTTHPIAALGFNNDFRAMQWADACVLVMPCGRSAHLELGWCAGAGKKTIVHIPEPCEPELMNLLANDITLNEGELIGALKGDPAGAADTP